MKRRTLLRGLPGFAIGAPVLAADPTWATVAPRIADTPLLDHQGHTHRLQALLSDGPVAVNFIYTGCVSFCPPQTAIFLQLQGLLALAPDPPGMLVSISIDPLSDTPSALAAYAARFDARLGVRERWLMLTGGPAQIDAVLAGFGLHATALRDHPSQVWVGMVKRARWTRTLGLASAEELARWMRAAAS
jgi:protein SCO1/2